MPDPLPLPWPALEEREFAKKTGLAPDFVRELRGRLLDAADWLRKKNRVVLLSPGIEKLLRATGALGTVLPATAASQEPTLALLVITKLCRNPRLVKASAGRAGAPVTVRVPGNVPFKVGQEIDAQRPDGGAFWQFVPAKKRRAVR